MRANHAVIVLAVFTSMVAVPAAASASSEVWRLSPDRLPVALGRMIALKLDDHRVLYIGGGSIATGPADTRRVFSYDTRTLRFDERASLPAAKNSTDVPGNSDTMTSLMAAGVLGDGSVVVAGGQISLDDADVNAQNMLSYRYYPGNDEWVRTGDLPEPQDLSFMPSNLLDDGRLVVVGGRAPTAALPVGRDSDKAFVYDPEKLAAVDGVDPNTGQPTGQRAVVRGAWDYTRNADGTETQMSEPHYYGNAVLLHDGRVFVAGGHTRWGNTSVMARHTDFFDPATGLWSRGPNLPRIPGEDDRTTGSHGGRGNGMCMTRLPNGKVLLAGGASATDGAEFFSTTITRQSILILTPRGSAGASTLDVLATRIPAGTDNARLYGDDGRESLACWLRGDGQVVFGGGQDSAFEDLYDTYVFDWRTGVIGRGPDLPHAVAKWAAAFPEFGYPPDYQAARMSTLSISMRTSRLVFHGGSMLINGGGINAVSVRGPNGVHFVEQLGP